MHLQPRTHLQSKSISVLRLTLPLPPSSHREPGNSKNSRYIRLRSHLSPLLQVLPLLALLEFTDFMDSAPDLDPDAAAAVEVKEEDSGAGVIGGGGDEMERSKEPSRSESGEEEIGVDADVENGGGGGIGAGEVEMERSEEPRRSESGGGAGGGGILQVHILCKLAKWL